MYSTIKILTQNESNGSFEKSRNKKEKRNQEQYTNLSSTNRLLRGKEDNYRYYKDEINKLKAPSSYQYKGLTYKEKKEKVKEYQKMMKEKREEYESISGKSLICADVSLENWNPSEDDLMEKCTHCGGDGKCIYCARRGNGKCSNCGGSGYLDIERIGCPNCDTPGNGKCKSCGGTGKCPTCHGKAKF